MKQLFISFLLLLCSQLSFSQIITVKVMESYPYVHNPDSYTVNILEVIGGYHMPADESIREAEFDSRMKNVIKFMEDNKYAYERLDREKVPKKDLAKGAVALNGAKLEIKCNAEGLEPLKEFVNKLGLRSTTNDTWITVDDQFLVECMSKLESKAKEEAEVYAKAINRTVRDIAEIRIIKHKTTKTSGKFIPKINGTHLSLFEVEYSFDTAAR